MPPGWTRLQFSIFRDVLREQLLGPWAATRGRRHPSPFPSLLKQVTQSQELEQTSLTKQPRMCTENKLTDNAGNVTTETQVSVRNNDGTESSRRKFDRLGLQLLMSWDTKKHSKNVAHEHARGTLFPFCPTRSSSAKQCHTLEPPNITKSLLTSRACETVFVALQRACVQHQSVSLGKLHLRNSPVRQTPNRCVHVVLTMSPTERVSAACCTSNSFQFSSH